jgi:hypothetical protein
MPGGVSREFASAQFAYPHRAWIAAGVASWAIAMIWSLVVSTIVFFVARHFVKRWADENDFPAGATRSVVIFSVALALSYFSAWGIDRVLEFAAG